MTEEVNFTLSRRFSMPDESDILAGWLREYNQRCDLDSAVRLTVLRALGRSTCLDERRSHFMLEDAPAIEAALGLGDGAVAQALQQTHHAGWLESVKQSVPDGALLYRLQVPGGSMPEKPVTLKP